MFFLNRCVNDMIDEKYLEVHTDYIRYKISINKNKMHFGVSSYTSTSYVKY